MLHDALWVWTLEDLAEKAQRPGTAFSSPPETGKPDSSSGTRTFSAPCSSDHGSGFWQRRRRCLARARLASRRAARSDRLAVSSACRSARYERVLPWLRRLSRCPGADWLRGYARGPAASAPARTGSGEPLDDEALDAWLVDTDREPISYSDLLALITPDAAVRREYLARFSRERSRARLTKR